MTATAGATELAQSEVGYDADLWGSETSLVELAQSEVGYDADLWGSAHWLSAELWARAVLPMMGRVSEALSVHCDVVGGPKLSEEEKRTDELVFALLGLALPALGQHSRAYSKILQGVAALLYHGMGRGGDDELSYWVELRDRQRVLLAGTKQGCPQASLPYVVNSWLAPLGLDGLDNVDLVLAFCRMIEPYLRKAEKVISSHAPRLGNHFGPAVAVPPSAEQYERRAEPRRQIRCATLIEPGGICATVVNVSAGGASVVSPRPLSIGTTVCLTLHTFRGTVEARGVVRRADEGARRWGDPAGQGLGIQFTQPPKNLAGLLGVAA